MVKREQKFLSDVASRPWKLEPKYGFQPEELFLGQGTHAIEVAVASSVARPTQQALTNTWKERKANRPAPVLLVVIWPEGVALCGPAGENPPVQNDLDKGQVERLCREILAQPNRHAARRYLDQALPSFESALPGISNEGLLTLHELMAGVPKRADWSNAGGKARNAIGKRDQDLIRALGFDLEELDKLTYLLRSRHGRAALAVLLRETEAPEAGAERFSNVSPVSYALTKADQEDLKWVILVQGNRLRLYSTDVGAGVGRRGRTGTYVECQPALLPDDKSSYFWLLFSADALAQGGSLSEILESSRRFSGSLASRLRERIYDEVVPVLAGGIAAARNLETPSPTDLSRTYEMALMVLFRLLFVAYAEDRDLLPYRHNEAYRRRSLKQKAQDLAQHVRDEVEINQGSHHWQEVVLLWQAVAEGNGEWGVPAYNGGLFSTNPAVSPLGAELTGVTLPNVIFEKALRALLVIETDDTDGGAPGPVDFRSLGVREFGTVYEGLLESELALAAEDLALDKKGVYRPVRPGQAVAVNKGEIYLHNRSGARKASGSYFTKSFVVEHLLDGALKPALCEHFARLDGLEAVDASEAFFDFRVADIAMGSGHFLVAAIDRIETGMAVYLAKRDLPGVRKTLARLREAARRELGESVDPTVIEDGQLLRRMIARHCIYGVDLNALSVQLARLAVWIHTFVPGLPLSMLDRTLVQGNALVGIGTIDEIGERFEGKAGSLLATPDAETLLGDAKRHLKRLANLNDATLEDIEDARRAMNEARTAISTTEDLCDLLTAASISGNKEISGFPFESWNQRRDDPDTRSIVLSAQKEIENLCVLHFPISFPEVFLHSNPGFDVILGNPPWEKVKIEEHAFWARYFPGLRGLSSREREASLGVLRKTRSDLVSAFDAEITSTKRVRQILVESGFPGMGAGDPDLYKAFCWRFWRLCATEGGRIGVVLPRAAVSAKGSEEFRKAVFRKAECVDIAMLENTRKWVFDEVDPRYTIALVCISRGTENGLAEINLQGPFASRSSFLDGVNRLPATFNMEDIQDWNDTAAIPLFPDPATVSISVFSKFCEVPRFNVNKNRTGGGRHHGVPAQTEKWMPHCRSHSWSSNGRPSVLGATRHRTPRNRAEVSNGFRKQMGVE